MSADDFPCHSCDAAAGEPCADDCEYSNGYVEFSALEWPEEDPSATRSIEESLAIIAAATHVLPYSAMVGVRGAGAPDRQDYDVQEYLAKLADWLAEYQPILRAMVDDLHEQSRKRISMQIERDVIDGVIRRALEGAPA